MPAYSSPQSAPASSSSSMRFHAYHGENIILSRERTVALRRASFADGIVFSDRPLLPNEIFMLEIDRNENGWSGHMRLGLTLEDPNLRRPLPHYTLPDMNVSGRAWVNAIMRHRNIVVYDGINGERDLPLNPAPLLSFSTTVDSSSTSDEEDDDIQNLPFRINRVSNFATRMENGTSNFSERHRANGNQRIVATTRSGSSVGVRLPTDVGSQIGVYFRLARDSTAEMHYVINGVDQGPSAVDIPYVSGETRLYAIVDVYGSTKQVRIVQTALCVAPLQHICRNCILKYTENEGIDRLPLPDKLKAFLRYRDRNSGVDENGLSLLHNEL